MKKIILGIFVFVTLFLITGCDNNRKKGEEVVNENKKTEEELIWEDALKDEIYNQRITIYDSVYISNNDFSKILENLNKLKGDNKFASKFLELLDKTNIQEIMDSGSDLEKYLLLSYLCLQTNHHEGLGQALNWVSNDKLLEENDKLINIYYRKQSFDKKGMFIKENGHSLPYYVFEYSSSDETNNKYIMSLGYYSNKYGNIYSNISLYKYDSMKDVKKSSKTQYTKVDWIETKRETINKVITNNKEFLDFYIKYKQEYYERFDEEKGIYGENSGTYVNKKSSPSIGMTTSEVENSTWGSPKKKNKDTYAWGTTEQWVYDRGYIYFKNGIVTSISEQ